MKHEVIINKKKYELPKKMSPDTYMEYLAVKSDMVESSQKGTSTPEQFQRMMDCICSMYDNQFTIDELKDRETGLSTTDIFVEFVALDAYVGNEVNTKIDKIRENFTKGK